MAQLVVQGSGLGTSLTDILMADDILPGSDPSYQLCKMIYTYHPLGKKLADAPITLAQSQDREIVVAGAPERVIEAFQDEWEKLKADDHIGNLASLSRVYGAAALVMLVEGVAANAPVDLFKIGGKKLKFNVLDPLNIAGSIVLDLDPNSFRFMEPGGVVVKGTPYDRNRTVVLFNENPIYLDYTVSAFGFVGRSVYQRCLYPLKSFLRTMIADDMVARKAGLIVAKMKAPGSIIDGVMTTLFGLKRRMLQEGQTDNVLGIDVEESIETLDMQNVNGAMEVSRRDIINNIAVAEDMPAIILNSETYVAGFGEGTEDAKNVSRYIEGVRDKLDTVYMFFDQVVMHRAWTPEFFETMQNLYPEEFGSIEYEAAFQRWENNFKAIWPSLIEEPESEKSKVDDVKLKAIIAMLEVLLPQMDPDNKTTMIEWACDNFNELERLFKIPLELDLEALANYEPPMPEEGGEENSPTGSNRLGQGNPFAKADAQPILQRLARGDTDFVLKSRVDYHRGTAEEHCGVCQHFLAPNSCGRVGGFIQRDAWCKLFTKHELKAA